MNAAGYARRSNDKRDDFSISDQERAIRAHCEGRGLQLTRIYVDDGVSGAAWAKRHAFQELLVDGAAGVFEVLVFQEQARLTRDPDIDRVMNMLSAAGIRVEATNDVMDWDTAAGRATVRMKAAMNAFYRESNGEYIRSRKLEMARQGYVNGDPPFGYVRDQDKRFRIVPHEAAAVRDSYALALQGRSTREIAEILNERSVRTRGGRRWTKNAVHDLLTRPSYAALVGWHYKTTREIVGPANHEAIVPVEVWNQVQTALRGRGTRPTDPHFGRRPYPLTGVARCQHGHPFAGAGRHHDARMMRCKAAREGGRSACTQPMVAAQLLEDQVGAYVSTMVIADDVIAAIVAEAKSMVAPPSTDLTAVKAALKNAIRLHRENYLDWEEFRQEAEPLRRQIRALERPAVELDFEQAAALIRDQGAVWHELSAQEQRAYVVEVFEEIIVDGAHLTSLRVKPNFEPLFVADRVARFDGVQCGGPGRIRAHATTSALLLRPPPENPRVHGRSCARVDRSGLMPRPIPGLLSSCTAPSADAS